MIQFVRIQLQQSLLLRLKEKCRIKEEFNKEVISILRSNIEKDNELCFLSYRNKKKKQVDKRYKGIAG
jgi:hypothetical protein